MQFKQTCALFGGPARVSRILNLKTDRFVRTCVVNNKPPARWIPILKEYAIKHANELLEFGKS